MISLYFISIFHSFGLVLFFAGLQGFFFLFLTPFYEIWKWRRLRKISPFTGKVSVLIPAYNEEKTIRKTILSLLSSGYPDLEVIVINDGSTDGTEEALRDLMEEGVIKYIKKTGGGKASALNRGMDAASGEVIVYSDADSIFLKDTIKHMVRWFGDPSIDAVCGNDAPLSASTPVQKFLLITTHIGTGFVRRALSLIGCLPIITGNLGAIRTSVLRELGGFREIWGEDLEITFRLHKAKKKIIFDPSPKVLADCPGTLKTLWNQRIRWIRSYIRIALLHKDLFLRYRWRPFSYYLPLNFFSMTMIPIIQILLVFVIPLVYIKGYFQIIHTGEILSYFGLIFFAFIAIYSIILDRTYSDLIYFPYGILLILPLSYFYNMVVLYSWWQELRKAEERWVKLTREEVPVKGGKGIVLASVVLALIFFTSFYFYHSRTGENNITPVIAGIRKHPYMNLAISTHFDSWDDWRKAITRVLVRKDIEKINVVGIGAGRMEWTYFKWKGQKNNWSNHQKGEKDDMLLTATTSFKKGGYRVAAIIDTYGPNYVKSHPEDAAVRYDGIRSREQICFTELVRGTYGRKLIDMIKYISKNYPVDIINLTELSYYTYSYNDKDLKSYKAFSGRENWPINRQGKIDIEDPSIWEWKSSLMEDFIRDVAEVVHREGKKLYVDVPVSWKDFRRNGRDSGLDYKYILRHADKIIVWNYFYLEDESPAVSERLARYLSENFPVDSFYVSIGLWGEREHINPVTLSQAIYHTMKGGSPFIWITPEYLLTEEHWKEIGRIQEVRSE